MRPRDGRRPLWSALVVAIDPSAFGDPAMFRQSVAQFLASVKSSRKAPGFDDILIPGERSFRTRRERLASGIPIDDDIWRQVAAIARDLGINPNEYATAS